MIIRIALALVCTVSISACSMFGGGCQARQEGDSATAGKAASECACATGDCSCASCESGKHSADSSCHG
jgi:hypothetical protein